MASESLYGREGVEIRSFRVVFELERRLHRIDRWRLRVPGGVPLRGIAYAAFVLLLVLVAGSVPGVGGLVGVVPPSLRFVGLPLAAGLLLTRVRRDGRVAHRFLGAWLRHRVAPKRICAFRPVAVVGRVVRFDEPVELAVDGAQDRYRRARVVGPARVLLRYPARATQRGSVLEIAQAGPDALVRGRQVSVGAGQELEVR